MVAWALSKGVHGPGIAAPQAFEAAIEQIFSQECTPFFMQAIPSAPFCFARSLQISMLKMAANLKLLYRRWEQ